MSARASLNGARRANRFLHASWAGSCRRGVKCDPLLVREQHRLWEIDNFKLLLAPASSALLTEGETHTGSAMLGVAVCGIAFGLR